ncbi:MAG: CheB methylesterase domain-containing protein [Armatimonadota bacterium]|nr:CheB methylesterase domain-containing protein [bacterium]
MQPADPLVVVIAASTGGPQALAQLLPRFTSSFSGTIIVAQEMRNGFTRVLADMLNQTCNLPVHEPVDGQILQPSRILMTPSNCRLVLTSCDFGEPGRQILVEDVADSPELRHSRIDYIMTSVAGAFGKRTVGVLLTGVGTDGREGMRAIHSAGGVTIAQDSASSVVFDLPLCAIEAGIVHETLPLWSIADRIAALAKEDADAIAA